jgi:hypothetical protein
MRAATSARAAAPCVIANTRRTVRTTRCASPHVKATIASARRWRQLPPLSAVSLTSFDLADATPEDVATAPVGEEPQEEQIDWRAAWYAHRGYRCVHTPVRYQPLSPAFKSLSPH